MRTVMEDDKAEKEANEWERLKPEPLGNEKPA